MAEQGLAFLFNAYGRFLVFADDYDVDFEDRFIEKAHGFFDRLVVDLDQEAAEELVEVIFETVSFFFSNFD